MSSNKIHKKLDQLFGNQRSRNFINHLVRSYLPVDKVKVVEVTPKEDFKCAITKKRLISRNEIIAGIEAKEYDEELMLGLRSLFDEEKQAENPLRNSIKGRQLGVTSEDTNTFMSYKAYQEFYSWVVKKMLEGDKHINWLINSINRDALLERAENVADTVDQISTVDKMKNTNRATTSLGDFEALQRLKDQMDDKTE